MKTEEMIAVMQAYLRGEKIEYRDSLCSGPDGWRPTHDPAWNWSEFNYRVTPKPAPKLPPGIFWVRFKCTKDRVLLPLVIYSDGSVPLSGFTYSLNELNEKAYWSPDRVKWFTFTGEEVPS